MSVDYLVTQFSSRGADALEQTLRRISGAFDDTETKSQKMQRVGTNMATFGAVTAGGLALIGAASLKASGELEAIKTGMQGALGSTEAVNAQMAKLEAFDRASPFNLQDTARAYQMLQGAEVATEKIVPLMTAIGNGVAQAGRDSGAFASAMQAIQQISSTGVLQKGELNQLVTAGLSPYKAMREELGMTQEEFNKALESGGISAEKAIDALTRAYSKGQFAGAMERQSETLLGKVSTLDSAFWKLKSTVGDVFNDDASKFIGNVTTLVDKTQEFAKAHPGIVKAATAIAGVGAGGAVALGVVGKVAGAINEIRELKTGGGAGGLLGGATGTMNVQAAVVNVNGGFGVPGGGAPGIPQMAGGGAAAAGGRLAAFLSPTVSAFGATASGAAALGIALGAVAVTALSVNDILNSAKDVGLSDEEYLKKRGTRGGIELDAARGLSDNSLARWWRGDNAANDAEKEAMRLSALNRQRAMNRRAGQGPVDSTTGTPYATAYAEAPPPPAVLRQQAQAKAARTAGGTRIDFSLPSVNIPPGGGDYLAADREATRLAGA